MATSFGPFSMGDPLWFLFDEMEPWTVIGVDGEPV